MEYAMWGSIHCSSSLLLVALAGTSMLLLPQPALSSPAASANLTHHEGGGGEKGNNQANALVAAVNANRTAARLPPLRNSKGLGCMALQYLSRCIASNPDTACSSDDTVLAAAPCDLPERDLTEVYAANCGVELPTVDLLSGRLIGCSSHLHDSSDGILVATNASAVLRGKEHTQVGAGLLRPRRHGPFFWCLLFSGGSPGETFRLEAAGRGIAQARGCFSDPDDALPCNNSGRRGRLVASLPLLLLLLPLLAAL